MHRGQNWAVTRPALTEHTPAVRAVAGGPGRADERPGLVLRASRQSHPPVEGGSPAALVL